MELSGRVKGHASVWELLGLWVLASLILGHGSNAFNGGRVGQIGAGTVVGVF